VVYLLVQQDGHDLARGRAAAEVARAEFEQITAVADVNQAVTGRRLFAQSTKTSSAVP
jgi:hypothetical protein